MDHIGDKYKDFLIYHEKEQYKVSALTLVMDADQFETPLHKEVMEEVEQFSNSQLALLFAR